MFRSARLDFEQLEDRQLLSVFTVTTVVDNGNNATPTAGSLRKAILDANAHANSPTFIDVINFGIAVAGVHTILPPAALPAITDPVFIDGSTQSGFSGTPVIQLDGTNAGAAVSGLTLNSGGSRVRALAINRFTGHGMFLNKLGDNVITGCFIGTDTTGTMALANGGAGIAIRSQDNTIGSTDAADRNVISGNSGDGIVFFGTLVPTGSTVGSNNTVIGNFIGTNAAGTAALPNGGAGIEIIDLATNETIGGATSGSGNLISGNVGAGIRIHNGANTIQGNLIGTNAAGTAAIANADGLNIDSSGNTIGGNFNGIGFGPANLISGNRESGIEIFGGVSNNVVQGNFIGTNKSGNAAVGNARNGVLIEDSTNNVVGGKAEVSPGHGQLGQTNIISGNMMNGVVIFSSTAGGTTGNKVQGNLIGTDLNAAMAIANGGDGIGINNAANNLIGGAGAGGPFNNYISANTGAGVHILGSGATGNMIQGNVIGLEQSASGDLGNHQEGVLIESPSNTVGGTTADARNVISGNDADGVKLSGNQAIGNTIQGNFIGTDNAGAGPVANSMNGVTISGQGNFVANANVVQGNTVSGNAVNGIFISNSQRAFVRGNFIGTSATGFSAVPNIGAGILIQNADSNSIGDNLAADRNIISGNGTAGVIITGSSFNSIQGNFIGTNINGSAAIPNTNGGVVIDDDSQGNLIGGTMDQAGNVISGNGADGIVLQTHIGANPRFNQIQGNIIGLDATGAAAVPNMGNGITLIDALVTTIGGPAAMARNVISSNTMNGVLIIGTTGGTLVQGNLIGTDQTGTVDKGNGNAGVLIAQAATNTVVANVISGNDTHGVSIINGAGSNMVTANFLGVDATGTRSLGNTQNGVNIDARSGFNSVTANLITGNLQAGVSIAHNSNSNFVQGNLIGTKMNGTEALGNATGGVVIFESSNNTIGGTGFRAGNVISGNSQSGVTITSMANPAQGNVVQGNLIGTDVSGTLDLGNHERGVFVNGGRQNFIGGTTAGARNIISGNDFEGVLIIANATNNLVQGNYIGTDITGTRALGNALDGVFVQNVTFTFVGGTVPGAGNVISGNGGHGVHIFDTLAHDTLVQRNLIGTQKDGASPLGNGLDGVFLKNASNNQIGGTDPLAGNTIAFNAGNGVTVGANASDTSTGNAILSNSIFSNGKLGIDLANDGVTQNHASSPTQGPNSFQNSPVIVSVTFNSALTTTTIQGTLTSTATSTFMLQLFASPVADPSGFGEGKTLFGATTVTTNASGTVAFTITATPAILIGQRITATATLLAGANMVPRDTSEFSRAVPVGTANQRFVAQVFRDLLQREADPSALSGFTSFLDQGNSRASFVNIILGSHEYHVVVVRSAFRAFLHRDPDPNTLAGFAGFLDSGGTVEQLNSFVVGSPEYFQVRGGGTSVGFVTALFQDALNRTPDPLGLAGFTLELMQGFTTTQVATQVFASPEYRGDLVASFYQRFLRRMADSTGLNAFVSALQQGGRDEQVIDLIMASDEYIGRL
jgi:hypothetical protein